MHDEGTCRTVTSGSLRCAGTEGSGECVRSPTSSRWKCHDRRPLCTDAELDSTVTALDCLVVPTRTRSERQHRRGAGEAPSGGGGARSLQRDVSLSAAGLRSNLDPRALSEAMIDVMSRPTPSPVAVADEREFSAGMLDMVDCAGRAWPAAADRSKHRREHPNDLVILATDEADARYLRRYSFFKGAGCGCSDGVDQRGAGGAKAVAESVSLGATTRQAYVQGCSRSWGLAGGVGEASGVRSASWTYSMSLENTCWAWPPGTLLAVEPRGDGAFRVSR